VDIRRDLAFSPLMRLNHALLTARGVRLWLKRDDLVHSQLSGNKWRKLKYNLRAMERLGQRTLVTFGGAFSNHVHAVAAAGRLFGFTTVGVIRGEAAAVTNPTLSFARSCGMELHFVDREDYRRKDDMALLAELRRRYGRFMVLPEGGSNRLGVAGCGEVVHELDRQLAGNYDVVACACGTGATLAGIAAALRGDQLAYGVAVLKGAEFLNQLVQAHLRDVARDGPASWRIDFDGHGGGYGRIDRDLVRFMDAFEAHYNVPLDPIYTAKMLATLYRRIDEGEFATGTRIVAVHTGGLQGRAGMAERIAALRP
jgi:1-aminocyclopropane-1-carboxylate deaminase/D-cysteine desulfhydrase-like pyridoxal-dependent ACC family enzyme